MTKFVFSVTFKVSLFAVSQSHNLPSSRFTCLRLPSAYIRFASSANKRKMKLFRTLLDIVNIDKKKQ